MGKISVSKEIKERIDDLSLACHSIRKMQSILKSVSQSCITKTISKYKETVSTLDKTRSGRPR